MYATKLWAPDVQNLIIKILKIRCAFGPFLQGNWYKKMEKIQKLKNLLAQLLENAPL